MNSKQVRREEPVHRQKHSKHHLTATRDNIPEKKKKRKTHSRYTSTFLGTACQLGLCTRFTLTKYYSLWSSPVHKSHLHQVHISFH